MTQRIDSIKVPTDDGINLYLKAGIVDISRNTHPAKIVVPKGTKAENELLMNNNDLSCLDFSKCNVNSPIVFVDNCCYFGISSEERQATQKE